MAEKMSPCVRGRANRLLASSLVILVYGAVFSAVMHAVGADTLDASGSSDDPNHPGVAITYNLTVSSQVVRTIDLNVDVCAGRT